MGKNMNYVVDSAGKGFGLIKKSAVPLYLDLVKVSALSTLVSLIGLAIVGILLFVSLGGTFFASLAEEAGPDFSLGTILVLLATIPIFIIFSLLSQAVGSVVFNVVDNRTQGKETTIIAQSKKNLMRVVRYTLIIWAIGLVILLPVLLSIFLGGMGAAIGICIFSALWAVAYVLFLFFTQFGMYELVLGRKGAVDSLKSSATLTRANILSVALLDIIVIVVGMATWAGARLFEVILQFIPATLSLGGVWSMLLGYAIYLVLYIGVTVLISAFSQVIVIPVVYNFWKGLKG